MTEEEKEERRRKNRESYKQRKYRIKKYPFPRFHDMELGEDAKIKKFIEEAYKWAKEEKKRNTGGNGRKPRGIITKEKREKFKKEREIWRSTFKVK